jgi:hypothetical protein
MEMETVPALHSQQRGDEETEDGQQQQQQQRGGHGLHPGPQTAEAAEAEGSLPGETAAALFSGESPSRLVGGHTPVRSRHQHGSSAATTPGSAYTHTSTPGSTRSFSSEVQAEEQQARVLVDQLRVRRPRVGLSPALPPLPPPLLPLLLLHCSVGAALLWLLGLPA